MEGFDHIHRSEHGGKFHPAEHIDDLAAEDEFCLFLRRERPRIQRAGSFSRGRAAVFPLDQPEVPVFCTNGFQGAHALENLRFVRSIFVISYGVHIAEHPGLHGGLYPGKAFFPVACGATEDLCLGFLVTV